MRTQRTRLLLICTWESSAASSLAAQATLHRWSCRFFRCFPAASPLSLLFPRLPASQQTSPSFPVPLHPSIKSCAPLLLCKETRTPLSQPSAQQRLSTMAEWPLSAQSSRWSSEVPAAPVVDAAFPKELQTATISLWTVVGAVQAVERTVEAQALRLLSLEQRSEMAEKRFGDCEKAVAELGTQLDSRWSALETLLQEYGQLQKRLETMEDLLKNGNFWFLKVPVNAAAAASKILLFLNWRISPVLRKKMPLTFWARKTQKNVLRNLCPIPKQNLPFPGQILFRGLSRRRNCVPRAMARTESSLKVPATGYRLPGRMKFRGSNRRRLQQGGMEETVFKALVMLTPQPSRTRRKRRARKTPPTHPSCSSSPGARWRPF
uniref:Uncharacterized protein n=1 Tax=Podarcis muralis TaxID=64176 RepID=A0A670JPV0_PODMU